MLHSDLEHKRGKERIGEKELQQKKGAIEDAGEKKRTRKVNLSGE